MTDDEAYGQPVFFLLPLTPRTAGARRWPKFPAQPESRQIPPRVRATDRVQVLIPFQLQLESRTPRCGCLCDDDLGRSGEPNTPNSLADRLPRRLSSPIPTTTRPLSPPALSIPLRWSSLVPPNRLDVMSTALVPLVLVINVDSCLKRTMIARAEGTRVSSSNVMSPPSCSYYLSSLVMSHRRLASFPVPLPTVISQQR